MGVRIQEFGNTTIIRFRSLSTKQSIYKVFTSRSKADRFLKDLVLERVTIEFTES